MAKVARSAAAYLALCAYPFLSFLSATPASAADDSCNKPLRLMASLPMTLADRSGRFTIPISFNGVEKQFLFDTGGAVMQVSSKIVEELKLPQHESPVELYGMDGSVSKKATTVKDITIGSMRGASLEMQVSPDDVDGMFAPLGWRELGLCLLAAAISVVWFEGVKRLMFR